MGALSNLKEKLKAVFKKKDKKEKASEPTAAEPTATETAAEPVPEGKSPPGPFAL